MMERIAEWTPASGFSDSAAATVTSSMPPNAKATASNAVATPAQPLGMKPTSLIFDRPTNPPVGSTPSHRATPMHRNATITTTLIRANQNSNSPKFFTAAKLITVKKPMAISAGIQGEMANHWATIADAPVISTAMIMIIMNQYSQPMAKPAQRPKACSA